MAQGGAAEGPAGVSSPALHGQLQVRVALFHEVHGREVRVRRAVGGAVFDLAAALVQHELQRHAPALQGLRQGPGAQVQRLLVVAEGEIHRPGKGPAVGEQVLRRLQTAEHLVFDVQSAPAPDVAAGNGAGEGRVGPVVLCALHHRHHVLVGHEQARPQGWVAAGQGDEQAVVADDLKGAGGHDVGIAFPDEGVELVELAEVGEAVVRAIDGTALDGPAQPLRGAGAVQVGKIVFVGKKVQNVFHTPLSSR